MPSDFCFSPLGLHVQLQHSRSVAAVKVSFHIFSKFQMLPARLNASFPRQLWEVGAKHDFLLAGRVGKLYQFLEVDFSVGWVFHTTLPLTGG